MEESFINDLIAANALYRPGAMDVNSHNEYVLRKFGKREVSYRWGMENILKDTYGLIILQENVLEIVNKLGGFLLNEADDIRRAMGKKQKDIIDKYKYKFIENIIKRGCPEDEANIIWHELEVHSGYSFCKAHAAAYSITGYNSQWFKVNYPIHFWSVAIDFISKESNNEKKISGYISEIYQIGDIVLQPPDINKSDGNVKTDFDLKTIYWPLSSTKQVGEISMNQIIEDRGNNSEYFSFEEFYERHNYTGSKVNKSTY